MADFTKTITNGLTLFGGETLSRWGSAVLGSDVWGYGSGDLITVVFKLFPETLTLTDETSPRAEFLRTFTATLVVTGDMLSETLIDSRGYKYVFGYDTNAENRPGTSYNSVVVTGTSYTRITQSSTSWTSV